jgi:WD40 repeat protein
MTPFALAKGFISDGTILFDPEGQGNGVQEVIEKYNRDMSFPEPFLSIQNCCLLLNRGYNMMSLDRRYAAIIREKLVSPVSKKDLIVTDGNSQITVALEKLQARDIAYWSTNTEVFLYPDENQYSIGTLILYNPFTQQTKVFSPTFPHLVEGDFYRVLNWDRAATTPKYDPSQSRVVYYFYDLGNANKAISLWDIEKNMEVWRRNLKPTRPWSSEPEWSPDGSQFAIFLPNAVRAKTLELTLVDRAGNETVLLDPAFSQKITAGSGITWSPNEQYLSFYVQDELGVRLLIYDFKVKQVWEPLPIEFTEREDDVNSDGIIWSPDSKQFLVNHFLAESRQFAYLVDVEKRLVYDFGYQFNAAVWLAPIE